MGLGAASSSKLMEFKDYYKILGVDRSADDKAIKTAYRKLARKYHPDVAKDPSSVGRFQEVNEAYEVLSDPEKRAAFDEFGERSLEPGFDAATARMRQQRGRGGARGAGAGVEGAPAPAGGVSRSIRGKPPSALRSTRAHGCSRAARRIVTRRGQSASMPSMSTRFT